MHFRFILVIADGMTVVKNDLKPPLIAKSIKIKPKTWSVEGIKMRVELYGCVAG